MTSDDRFDGMIAGWLAAAGRRRAPVETLESVLKRTRATRPLSGWRARITVPPMRRESMVLVGAPSARRLAIVGVAALLALTAVLVIVAAMALRTKLSQTELFVYVADPATQPAEFCTEVHDCRNGLASWPGGRFLLAQDVGAAEPRVLVEAPWPSTIFDPRGSPDGSHLAYVRTQVGYPASCMELVTLDLATGEEHLVSEIAGGWDWTIDPDRGADPRLLFSAAGRCSPGGDGIFAFDLERQSTTLVFDVAQELGAIAGLRFGRDPVSLVAVHPDGRHALVAVAFLALQEFDTFVVSIDGTEPPEAVGCVCDGVGGRWSPDGASMLVESRHGSLSLGSGDGTGFRAVADLAGSPAWSPDGSAVAYLGPAPGPGDGRVDRGVYVVGAAEGEPSMIARGRFAHAAITTPPRWSPSGEWIYWSDADGTWAIRPDGSDRRQMVLPAEIDLLWLSAEAR